MKLSTKRFGDIVVNDNDIIKFESGLPGFPDDKELVIVSEEVDNADEDKKSNFVWLQSVKDSELAFAMLNVYSILPNYNPLADENELSELGELGNENLIIYNILTVPDDYKQTTVNLRAPVVINVKTNRGKQVILNNDEYSVRHYVFDRLENK